MPEKLKPCPFCGGKAGEVAHPNNKQNKLWAIKCRNPDCEALICTDNLTTAIAAWNKRVEEKE